MRTAEAPNHFLVKQKLAAAQAESASLDNVAIPQRAHQVSP